MFVPSNNSYNETKRAEIRTENFKLLTDMYYGPDGEMKCIESGSPAFVDNPYSSGQPKFDIQWDHIREYRASVDKTYQFGGYFAGSWLHRYPEKTFEFVGCQPLSQLMHSCKGIYAKQHAFSLKDVNNRSFILQSKENYQWFCDKYDFDWPAYEDVIWLLSEYYDQHENCQLMDLYDCYNNLMHLLKERKDNR